MKRLAWTVATLLLAVAANAETVKETVDRTLDVRPGALVVLTNVNGSIRISSWDQPRVHVVANKEVDADRDDAKDVLRELQVEISARDGGVVINTRYPKQTEGVGSILEWLLGHGINAKVEYEVTVPRTMNLQITDTNGRIHVADVTGSLELETTNGRIEAERCAGSMKASTTNGAIQAELVRVAKGQPMRFETTNGRIELKLPRDFAANVDAETTNGSIHTDVPITTTDSSRNSLRGTMNGGGTPLRLHTTNGGITISAI